GQEQHAHADPNEDEEQDGKVLFQHDRMNPTPQCCRLRCTLIATCVACASVRQSASRPSNSGADGETRTHTANATAPSRQRVYQFHHVGFCHFGISLGFESVSFGGAVGVVGAAPCGTSDALVSLAAGAGTVSVTPCFI